MSCSIEKYEWAAQQLFPQSTIRCLAAQGGCSTTFLVQNKTKKSGITLPDCILQFRPKRFNLDVNIATIANQTYGRYAPITKQIALASLPVEGTELQGVLCYEMEAVPGVSYASVAPSHHQLDDLELRRQQKLIKDFADFAARGWTTDARQGQCNGKVGLKITSKLLLLTEELPTSKLRAVAKRALDNVEQLQRLPIVLNHGDLIPSNIMVDDSGSLSGLVDWAEAECLPFGICLYGLEYLLGYTSGKRRDSLIDTAPFRYYSCSDDLRRLFWRRLQSNIPVLGVGEEFLKAVLMAKRVGTLLWYGFAWDDGAIDRVVNFEKDPQELEYLEAFLGDDLDRVAL